MKVLRISYKGKEITRQRVSSPLILIGRSPLCDVLLRAPGVHSVHFVFEWIGEGEFNAEAASKDEWVVTEVSHKDHANTEKKIRGVTSGLGNIFHETPLKIKNLEFSWIEDRLFESDLSKKILSQQLTDLSEQNSHIKGKNIPSVLEVINIDGEVSSVSDVHHFSFFKLNEWQAPILTQFATTPISNSEGKAVQLTIPSDAEIELIHQGNSSSDSKTSIVTLAFNDLLHIDWKQREYYFRIVPKVMGAPPRRSII